MYHDERLCWITWVRLSRQKSVPTSLLSDPEWQRKGRTMLDPMDMSYVGLSQGALRGLPVGSSTRSRTPNDARTDQCFDHCTSQRDVPSGAGAVDRVAC